VEVVIIYDPRMGADLRGRLWMLQKAIRVFPCNPWFLNLVACQRARMLIVGNVERLSCRLCVFFLSVLCD
jgi:hypothetical protein